MNVLITGARGFLDSYIVDKCIVQGDTIRVLVRKTSNINYLKKYPSIEYVYGDLIDMDHCAKQRKESMYLPFGGSYQHPRRPYSILQRQCTVDSLLSCLVDEAKKQGIKRFIFISSPSIFLISLIKKTLIKRMLIRINTSIYIQKKIIGRAIYTVF